MNNGIARLRSNAELAAGKRDGRHIDYELFKEDDWKGEQAKYKPTELYVRRESGEVGPTAKELAADTLRLIDHVRDAAEAITSLINALPVHDAAGRVLRGEIQDALHDLTDRFSS